MDGWIPFFEAMMLVCFGAGWPFAVLKTWKTKSGRGKSLLFLILILSGYVCGILFKILGETNLVLLLYISNGSFVLTEFILVLVYRARERKGEPPRPSPAWLTDTKVS